MIDDNQIQSLKKIIKEETGKDLSAQKSFEVGRSLIELFEILLSEENERKNEKSK